MRRSRRNLSRTRRATCESLENRALLTSVGQVPMLMVLVENGPGYEQDFHRPVYPIDRVKPEDFFAAPDIARMKSRMAGWVLSLARTGR